jgi:hypothetical protein
MKFRFYITSTFDGSITGTDSEEIARNYAQSEECFVVDAETGIWLASEDREVPIQQTGSANYTAFDGENNE